MRCGSDEWRAHAAQAARGGLLAAQLAKGGVLGAPDALEGPKGFLRALVGLEETPARWRSDPRPEAILHAIAKPWAALGDNCPAVAAAVHGFIGFAVGRTTFWDPCVDWRNKKLTREAAVAEIARRYKAWVDIFEKAQK